jgi:proline dehydrogenase
MDSHISGVVDFITLSKHLSSFELREMQHVHDRALAIASEAAEHGIKLLFDAEQTWVQPAIDNLVLNLQETFNDTSKSDFPVIFQTYQCYLKGALQRIEEDVKRSQRMRYHFGAKLVRGAYMHSERQRAMDFHIASPIHDTIEDTHASYDGALEFLLSLQHPRNQSMVEIMIATHNQKSVEKAVQLMIEKHIAKEKGKVHFAQLLGMSDNLSFPLGKEGYSVFKYVPYGKVEEAIPYLLRRAAENRDVLKSSNIGLQMNYKELIRRLGSLFVQDK